MVIIYNRTTLAAENGGDAATAATITVETDVNISRRRGRPPGSKNKQKNKDTK